MSTAVATKKNAELSTDVMDDIFAIAGEGASFEASELQIPFIRLAQQMSPELNKKDAKFIAGLSAGDMFNTLTHQTYDGEEGIEVIPCYITTKYLEFVDRDLGGGFVGEIDPSDPVLKRTTKNGTKDMLPNGNQVVTSDQYYCLVLDGQGSFEPAVIDMKVTQMKVSRRWKSQISLNKAKNPKTGELQILPLVSTIWKLTTVDETNRRNETYSNYAVHKVGMVQDRDLFMEAKTFRDSIKAGEVKANDPDNSSTQRSGSQDGSRGPRVQDDEIPF